MDSVVGGTVWGGKYRDDWREMNQVIERTGRKWMVLVVGLCGKTSERMIDAVKEFLEKMWYARSRN